MKSPPPHLVKTLLAALLGAAVAFFVAFAYSYYTGEKGITVEQLLKRRGVPDEILTAANNQWCTFLYTQGNKGVYYIVENGSVSGYGPMATATNPPSKPPLTSIAPINQKTSELNLHLDASGACKLAEVIFVCVYGERVLEKRPWQIKENADTVEVRGTLPPGFVGGVPEITIRKSDAKVIQLSHGK